MVETKITAEPGKSTIIATVSLMPPDRMRRAGRNGITVVGAKLKTTVEDGCETGRSGHRSVTPRATSMHFVAFSTGAAQAAYLHLRVQPCRAMSCLRRIRSRTSKTGRDDDPSGLQTVEDRDAMLQSGMKEEIQLWTFSRNCGEPGIKRAAPAR